MRLAFCKFNNQNGKIYFHLDLRKVQKDCGIDGLQDDILFLHNVISPLFMTSNSKYAMTFKTTTSANLYRFFNCISSSIKLIDLDKLEY